MIKSLSISVAEWSNSRGEPAQITVGGKLLKTGLLLQTSCDSGKTTVEKVAPVKYNQKYK